MALPRRGITGAPWNQARESGAKEVVSMMWYWGGGVHWWGWLLGALGMVAFWGLVIWVIWFFVTGVTRRPEHGQRSVDAKGILDERLARGEIDTEEYRRLRDLMAGEHVGEHAGEHVGDRDGVGAGGGQAPAGTGGRR